MTLDEILQYGVEAHNKAIKQLTQLGGFIKRAGIDFDINNSIHDFDAIMQGFLLKIAISDNDFSVFELAYIKCVCDKADVLQSINNATQGQVDVSWENIKSLSPTTLSVVVELINTLTVKYCEKFVVPFALVDAVLEQDVLKAIVESIKGIIVALVFIDGDSSNTREKMAVVDSIRVFENAWRNAINSANRQKSSTATASVTQFHQQVRMHSTLKSRYQPRPVTNTALLGTKPSSELIDVSPAKAIDYNGNKSLFLETILYIETDRGSGTGFFCNPKGYAITCAHVVHGAKEIYVRVGAADKTVRKAHVIYSHLEVDIAILLVEGVRFFAAAVDYDNIPMLGDEVIILGYPFGTKVSDDVMNMSVSFTRGYVSSRQRKNHIAHVLLDVSAKAGNSGSPVLDRRTGKVIGILCGSITNNSSGQLVEEINYMRPIKYVERLLAE